MRGVLETRRQGAVSGGAKNKGVPSDGELRDLVEGGKNAALNIVLTESADPVGLLRRVGNLDSEASAKYLCRLLQTQLTVPLAKFAVAQLAARTPRSSNVKALIAGAGSSNAELAQGCANALAQQPGGSRTLVAWLQPSKVTGSEAKIKAHAKRLMALRALVTSNGNRAELADELLPALRSLATLKGRHEDVAQELLSLARSSSKRRAEVEVMGVALNTLASIAPGLLSRVTDSNGFSPRAVSLADALVHRQ